MPRKKYFFQFKVYRGNHKEPLQKPMEPSRSGYGILQCEIQVLTFLFFCQCLSDLPGGDT